jgi:hypothetical protein
MWKNFGGLICLVRQEYHNIFHGFRKTLEKNMNRGSIIACVLFLLLVLVSSNVAAAEEGSKINAEISQGVEKEVKPVSQVAKGEKVEEASNVSQSSVVATAAPTNAEVKPVEAKASSSDAVAKEPPPAIGAQQDPQEAESSKSKNNKATAVQVELQAPPPLVTPTPEDKSVKANDEAKKSGSAESAGGEAEATAVAPKDSALSKPAASSEAVQATPEEKKDNEKKPHEDTTPESPYNKKLIADPPLEPVDEVVPNPPPRLTKKPVIEDAEEDDRTPPKLTPAKEVAAPEGGNTPVDESLYKFAEASMSFEMKVFEGVMYFVAAAVVITLLYRGLDAAGFDKAFFLRFTSGTSKLALFGRGFLHVASFIGWLVASCMMLIFEGIVCLCKKKQFTPIQVPTQILTSSINGDSTSIHGAAHAGMKLGGASAAPAKKPLMGKKPAPKANADGWSNAWSDEDEDTKGRRR